MPGEPLVSVLMSVYNDRRYLGAAVESILAQTLRDFELIVIDDGSTDGSRDLLSGLSDARVRLVTNESNIGLTRSLNFGLQYCRGRYVARMDADDVATLHRLETQVAFLSEHSEIGIVGSARQLVDESDRAVGLSTPPADDLSIRWKCLLGNPFAHPTVMIRRDVLETHQLHYDESFRSAQDYELWTRLLQFTRGANLSEPLVTYRLRCDGISGSRRSEQIANHDRIALSAIRRFVPNFPVTLDDVTNLRGRYGGFSVREAEYDPGDSLWSEKVRKLLCEFTRAHAEKCGIGDFVTRESLRIDQLAATTTQRAVGA